MGVEAVGSSGDDPDLVVEPFDQAVGGPCSDHDALGHARRKRIGVAEGPFDLAFTYDAAERLTALKEHKNNGTGRMLKSFAYGTGTSASDRSRGKVKTAARHNYVLHPDNGNSLEVVVTETYTYGGTAGRVSGRATRV